eukprot:4913149-Amphidinium_carterae.1
MIAQALLQAPLCCPLAGGYSESGVCNSSRSAQVPSVPRTVTLAWTMLKPRHTERGLAGGQYQVLSSSLA